MQLVAEAEPEREQKRHSTDVQAKHFPAQGDQISV
jgi:hypothetical protein